VKKAILWDVGGTIFLHTTQSHELIAQGLIQIGIDPRSISQEKMKLALGEFVKNQHKWHTIQEEKDGYGKLVSILTEESAVTQKQREQLTEHIFNYYDCYTIVADIKALLEELREKGFTVGIVSNWMPSLHFLLKHHNMDHYFDLVLCSGEVGLVKPNAGIFLEALNRLEITADEAIYIGNDLEDDIYSVKPLGITAIHFEPERGIDAELSDVDSLRTELFRLLSKD